MTGRVNQGPSGFLKLMSDYGEGRRLPLTGSRFAIVTVISVAMIAYTLWYALLAPTNRHFNGALFFASSLPVLFLTVSAGQRFRSVTLADWLLALAGASIGAYFALNDDFYDKLIQGMTRIPIHEQVIGLAAIALSAEACRRALGWGLTGVLVVLLAYAAFGNLLPGELGYAGTELDYFITIQTVTTEGLFGAPLEVAATYAILFITFGAFFHHSGGGELFFDVASAATGRSRGGASKACVATSGLYGSISGSPVADVVTTGPITIPLMRKMGLSAERAAGIEAAASSGGALLPPVMGAVAFLMVEYTAIPYHQIALAAFLPAVLYYAGIFLLVHLDALQIGEGVVASGPRPTVWAALKRHWQHLPPIVVLVYLLMTGWSPAYVAAASILTAIVCSWLGQDRSRCIGPKAIVECCRDSFVRIAPLAGAVMASGVIVGCIILTGLSGKFSIILGFASGGVLVPMLIVSAILLVLLGMGMPSASVYIMGVALLAPTIIEKFQLPLLQTHLFLIYYACASAITPPLAVACFAAAAIAESNALKTAFWACRFGFIGFLIPFYFVFNPGILLLGDVGQVLGDCALAVVMVGAATFAVQGSVWGRGLGWLARTGFALLALGIIVPYVPLQIGCAAVTILATLVASRTAQAEIKERGRVES